MSNERRPAMTEERLREILAEEYERDGFICSPEAIRNCEAAWEVNIRAMSRAVLEGRGESLEEAAKAVEDAGGDNVEWHADAIRALITPPREDSGEEDSGKKDTLVVSKPRAPEAVSESVEDSKS